MICERSASVQCVVAWQTPQSPVDSQWREERREEPIRVKLSSRGQHRAAHALVISYISANKRLCKSPIHDSK